MSTSCHIYCRDCHVEVKPYHVHSGGEVRQYHLEPFMANLEGLAVSGAVLPEDAEVTLGCWSIDVRWFATHRGHRIVVRDEYGGMGDDVQWGTDHKARYRMPDGKYYTAEELERDADVV